MTREAFDVVVRHGPDAVRVEVHGELDLTTVPELQRVLEQLHGQHVDEVVVDLRHVTFIGSTALHACEDLDAAARRDGRRLRFVRPDAHGAWMPFVYVGLADRLPFSDAISR